MVFARLKYKGVIPAVLGCAAPSQANAFMRREEGLCQELSPFLAELGCCLFKCWAKTELGWVLALALYPLIFPLMFYLNSEAFGGSMLMHLTQ